MSPVRIEQVAKQSEKLSNRDLQESPRVTDNDKGEITVAIDGKELRGWEYRGDTERRQKMLMAREYVEGWHDGRGAVDRN